MEELVQKQFGEQNKRKEVSYKDFLLDFNGMVGRDDNDWNDWMANFQDEKELWKDCQMIRQFRFVLKFLYLRSSIKSFVSHGRWL